MINIDRNKIKVHFDDWPRSYDEWTTSCEEWTCDGDCDCVESDVKRMVSILRPPPDYSYDNQAKNLLHQSFTFAIAAIIVEYLLWIGGNHLIIYNRLLNNLSHVAIVRNAFVDPIDYRTWIQLHVIGL